MQSLGLRWLASEWPTEVAEIARSFVEDGVLRDHEGLGAGDGRVTAGHLAVLRGLAAERELGFFGFDTAPCTSPGPGESEWDARDRAMAEAVLGGCLVGACSAGFARDHDPLRPGWVGSTTSRAAAFRLGATADRPSSIWPVRRCSLICRTRPKPSSCTDDRPRRVTWLEAVS